MNILDHIDLKTLIMMLGLDLKEKQGYFLGKCPFHDDTSPSFSISKKGFYKCFSCPSTGSLSKLIYELTGKSAYTFLNIKDVNSFLFENTMEEKKRDTFTQPAGLKIKGSLLNVYDNEEVLNYLSSRIVEKEFIDFFQIKYCSSMEVNGTPFKNRIMIPVYEKGTLKGYEGRDFTKTQKPKVLYNRGMRVSTLFNIDNLDRTKPLIVCEGMWDIPQIWLYITKNVTHTFGCTLSNHQKKLLNEFEDVTFFMDADEAGRREMIEIDEFMEKEFYIARGKEGQDPGDMSLIEINHALNNKVLSVNYMLDNSSLFEEKIIEW